VGKHEKDVWDKSRLLLHGEDTLSDVLGHVGEIWDGGAADGKCDSHDFGVLVAATAAAERIGAELRSRWGADLVLGF